MTNNGTITNMSKFSRHVPILKVDEERRIVSGFATLSNVDLQGDRVLTDASVKAFGKFRGNIREQHTNIAAGRMLSFGVEKFFDTITKKVYDGIFVRAYISKGAESTWLKVKDGTLNGFSIGGDITDAEDEIDSSGNMIRVIKDYDLYELSLVDSPANPLANVVSIEKAHGMFDEMATDLEKDDDNMEESVDVIEEPVAVEPEPLVAVEEVVEVEPEPVVAVEEPVVEPVVEPEAVVTPEENDIAVLRDTVTALRELLESQNATLVGSVQGIVDAITAMNGQISAVNEQVGGVKSELTTVKSAVTKFDQRVEAVEKDTAVRKSGDLGEVAQGNRVKKESFWGGSFLSVSDL